MIDTYFISDTHFGHKNILEYEKEARPFDSLEEMNEKIIENWNKTVRPKDVVFHLGDFAFGKFNINIAERLNGRKKLVLGNHDVYDINTYLRYFERIYGAFHWNRCILTHVPVHPSNLGNRFWINVHGHLHSKTVQTPVEGWHEIQTTAHPIPILVRKPFDNEFEDDLSYFNVSCEQNNLTPIHADVIRERLKEIDE